MPSSGRPSDTTIPRHCGIFKHNLSPRPACARQRFVAWDDFLRLGRTSRGLSPAHPGRRRRQRPPGIKPGATTACARQKTLPHAPPSRLPPTHGRRSGNQPATPGGFRPDGADTRQPCLHTSITPGRAPVFAPKLPCHPCYHARPSCVVGWCFAPSQRRSRVRRVGAEHPLYAFGASRAPAHRRRRG